MEERFWNSIHRLKNALSCCRVLPGAGAIEIACIRRLNQLAGKNSDYRPVITNSFRKTSVFWRYFK